jgi:hypothetical protein
MILFALFFGLPFCFFLLLFNFLEGGKGSHHCACLLFPPGIRPVSEHLSSHRALNSKKLLFSFPQVQKVCLELNSHGCLDCSKTIFSSSKGLFRAKLGWLFRLRKNNLNEEDMVIKVRQGHCLVIGLVHFLKILTLSCFFFGTF